MKSRFATAFLSAILIVSNVQAAEAEQASISSGSLTTHIYYLASDELGGRGVGTEGIDKAADYIANEFKAYGLKPGGDDGSYFQDFDMSLRKKITEKSHLQFTGIEQQPVLHTDFVPMPFSSMNSFEGVLAFVGYGITNEEKKHDDYAHVDVNGKVALMLRREPPAWTEENGGQYSRHAGFMEKTLLAKDKGAVAVLIVNLPDEEKDKLYRFRASGGRGDFGLPLFHIKQDLADKLLRAGGMNDLKAVVDRLAQGDSKVYGELKGITAKGDPGLEAKKTTARNVVAILPGAGPLAKEYVVFGGHYDHLGTVPPTMRPRVGEDFDPDKAEIHNGADDNASGTAGVMELARVYAAGDKPRRSLVFMAFTAEESGLKGSEHFVEHPTIPLDDVVAMINLDMIGRLGDKPLHIYGTKSATEFEGLVEKHVKDQNLGDFRMLGAGLGPSDHSSFYKNEIPVLFMFTGLHGDYHKPTDDADKIDYEGQVRVLEFVKAVADDIIGMEPAPTYHKVATPAQMLPRMPKVVMGILPDYSSSDDDPEPGWLIGGVSKGRAAENAGMKQGDRILSIAGQEVGSIHDYMRALRGCKPGDEVEVVVKRGDEKLPLKVKLEGR